LVTLAETATLYPPSLGTRLGPARPRPLPAGPGPLLSTHAQDLGAAATSPRTCVPRRPSGFPSAASPARDSVVNATAPPRRCAVPRLLGLLLRGRTGPGPRHRRATSSPRAPPPRLHQPGARHRRAYSSPRSPLRGCTSQGPDIDAAATRRAVTQRSRAPSDAARLSWPWTPHLPVIYYWLRMNIQGKMRAADVQAFQS